MQDPVHARRADHILPRDGLEERLAELWGEILETRDIGVADNFYDLGGDSVKAVALLTALEDLAPAEIFPPTILDAPTIAELASIIRAGRAPTSKVLLRMQHSGSERPCFFVHSHGGTVALCVPLARSLAPDQPFYGLQSVGLTGDQHPLTSIEAMAARYLEAIREVEPRGPYHLGGVCFGGVIALEMAHQLVARGEAVASLFIADVTPKDFPALTSAALRRRFRRRHRTDRRGTISQRAREFGRLAAARLYISGGLPLPGPLREVALVNRAALARYTARTWPGRATLLLRAEHSSDYAPGDWGRLAAKGVEIQYVPGANDLMWKEPNVRAVAAHLRAALHSAGT